VIARNQSRPQEVALRQNANEISALINDGRPGDAPIDQDANRIEQGGVTREDHRLGDHEISRPHFLDWSHVAPFLGHWDALLADRPHAPHPCPSGLLSPPQVPRMPPRPESTPMLKPLRARAKTAKLKT
jgi:hypothetical protein